MAIGGCSNCPACYFQSANGITSRFPPLQRHCAPGHFNNYLCLPRLPLKYWLLSSFLRSTLLTPCVHGLYTFCQDHLVGKPTVCMCLTNQPRCSSFAPLSGGFSCSWHPHGPRSRPHPRVPSLSRGTKKAKAKGSRCHEPTSWVWGKNNPPDRRL